MQFVLDYGHMRDNTGILLYLFRQSCEITCTFSCIVLLLYSIYEAAPVRDWPGSGPKLVEDADALVLQETLTRFGLNSHHQRDLEVKGQKGRLRLTRLPAIVVPTCTV